jgi:hypothetical protein
MSGSLHRRRSVATPDLAFKSKSSFGAAGIWSEEAECRYHADALRARKERAHDDKRNRGSETDQLRDCDRWHRGQAGRLRRREPQIGIILTIETLSALLMTLPAIASSAVKRVHNDPSMRITYPLREFEIELGPDNLRILTIGTPDGFTVSFSLTEELSQELGKAHPEGGGCRAKTH